MNPLKHLLPALYAQLASPALTYNGSAVKVYEHLAGNNAEHYVLLSQPTATPGSRSITCRQWSCTVLIDVVTQFHTVVSSIPADELADQITDRLDALRLTLPGYDCGPGQLDTLFDAPTDLTGKLTVVRRLLRYRWEVYYHAASTYVPPDPDFNATYDYLYAGGGFLYRA